MISLDYVRLYPKLWRAYAVLFSKFRLPLPPLHTFFEVTYRCNLRCHFCQFLEILERKSPAVLGETEISLDEIRRMIAQVPPHTLITLSGGEPLLRQDFCDIVAYACRRHKVHVITNGTLMDETVTRRLMGLRIRTALNDGLLWISFSLQGDRKTHDRLTGVRGSFDRTVAGIRRFIHGRSSRYPCVNIQTVINESNVTCLSHIVEVAGDLSVGLCNFIAENSGNHFNREDGCGTCDCTSMPRMPRIDRGLLNEHLNAADRQARTSGVRIRYPMGGRKHLVDYYSVGLRVSDFVCYVPWTTMVICADGEARSCFGHSLGSLKEKSLREIWQGKEMALFRSRLLRAGAFSGCIGCCMLQPKKQR